MAEPALLRFAGRLRRGDITEALQHRLRDRSLNLRVTDPDDDPPPPAQDELIHRLPLLTAAEIETEMAKWPSLPSLAPCRARLRQVTLHLDELSRLPTLAPDLHRDLLIILAAAPGDSRSRQRLVDQFFSTRGTSLVDFHLQLRQVQRHCPALWQLESSFLGFLPELAPLGFWQKLFRPALHDAGVYVKATLILLPSLALLAMIFWPESQPQIKPRPKPKAAVAQAPNSLSKEEERQILDSVMEKIRVEAKPTDYPLPPPAGGSR